MYAYIYIIIYMCVCLYVPMSKHGMNVVWSSIPVWESFQTVSLLNGLMTISHSPGYLEAAVWIQAEDLTIFGTTRKIPMG